MWPFSCSPLARIELTIFYFLKNVDFGVIDINSVNLILFLCDCVRTFVYGKALLLKKIPMISKISRMQTKRAPKYRETDIRFPYSLKEYIIPILLYEITLYASMSWNFAKSSNLSKIFIFVSQCFYWNIFAFVCCIKDSKMIMKMLCLSYWILRLLWVSTAGCLLGTGSCWRHEIDIGEKTGLLLHELWIRHHPSSISRYLLRFE